MHGKCNARESSWNHPPTRGLWKNCLPQNQPLVPKRLGTTYGHKGGDLLQRNSFLLWPSCQTGNTASSIWPGELLCVHKGTAEHFTRKQASIVAVYLPGLSWPYCPEMKASDLLSDEQKLKLSSLSAFPLYKLWDGSFFLPEIKLSQNRWLLTCLVIGIFLFWVSSEKQLLNDSWILWNLSPWNSSRRILLKA